VELPADRAPTGWPPTRWSSTSPRRKAAGQAQGQEDRAGLPRQPLRQGADRPAAGARQDARLRPAAAAGAHPGVEQKATWLQIRQNKPDYVLLWGWGVMNSTAIKEAQATGLPAREDVRRVVVGRRARRQGRRRRAPRATTRWPCSTAPSRTPRSSRTSSRRCMPRARAPVRRKKSARCCTCAA
jgi:hypothetical protein